jgi:SPP1 gp7 family putative phage head morphogenesis protein
MLLTNLLNLIENTSKKIIKTENKIFKQLGTKITNLGKQLLQTITKPFNKIKSIGNLLPKEKASILQNQVKSSLSPKTAQTFFTNIFARLFKSIDNLSSNLGVNILKLLKAPFKQTKIKSQVINNLTKESVGRVNQWGDKFNQQTTGLLELAYSSGWSPQKLGIAIKTAVQNVISRVRNIVVTSSSSLKNTVLGKTYLNNGINLVQWVATNDDRICPFCSVRHLKVYKLEEVTIPAHGNCRCFLLPFDPKWLDDGTLSREEVKRYKKDIFKENTIRNYGVSPFEKSNGRTNPPEEQVKI